MEKLEDSKDCSKILPCSLECCKLCEQRSKANSPSSYFLGVQRERDCNFENHVPELMEVRVAEKGIFPLLGLHPMFVTKRTAVASPLKTTTTTSLFEKLYIHMFSFLNNSIAIWCVRNYSQLLIFFSLQREILHNLKLHSCWKPGLSERILIVDSVVRMSCHV